MNSVTNLQHSARETKRVRFDRRTHEDPSARICVPELSPLVEPGTYNLGFVHHRTAVMFGRSPKLELRFRIVDLGRFNLVEVSRWYNVKKLKGKQGKNGGFVPSRRGDFLREYLTLFPGSAERLDRISMRPFSTNIVQGRLETVTTNSRQKSYPEPMQYSIVKELIGVGA